jgi:thiol:disulfide interchange protein DsbD
MPLLRALLLFAILGVSSAFAASPTPLPADQAFALTAQRSAEGIRLQLSIAPGTYLYREQIAARREDGQSLAVATPPGTMKDDPNFGPVEIYREAVTGLIATADSPVTGTVTVTFQGCTDAGICYPPVRRSIEPATLAVSDAQLSAVPPAVAPELPPGSASSDDGAALLRGGSLGWTALAFLGFGLLLSLTPCVYPMVPILVGILAGPGQQAPGWRRGLALAGAYVLAMAAAYAVLGVAAAWSGVNLQAVLQAPWALALMAAMLALLALGMFGAFELSLPALRLGSGDSAPAGLLRAAGLGFGAALIVGPCVTPPLAAALIYIAQSGDLLQGASALFALGLGMGLPLLLVGAFGAQVLPRSGPWLVKVRQLFGFMMLGVAIVLLARVLPAQISLLLWAALALALGVFLGAFDRVTSRQGLLPRSAKAMGLLTIIYGATLAVGASAGGDDPLRPLAGLARGGGEARSSAGLPTAAIVTSPETLSAALAAAAQDKPVFLQFTAEWCTICKDIERDVLSDPKVQAALAGFTVIKADVTRDTDGSRALMKQLQVVGPPTLLVLEAASGRERAGSRITGMTSADTLLSRLAPPRASLS